MIEETPLLAKGRPRRLLCTEALLNLVMSCDGTDVRNHKSVVFEVRAVPPMLTLVTDNSRGPEGDVKTQDRGAGEGGKRRNASRSLICSFASTADHDGPEIACLALTRLR